jgi:hypothetical protein
VVGRERQLDGTGGRDCLYTERDVWWVASVSWMGRVLEYNGDDTLRDSKRQVLCEIAKIAGGAAAAAAAALLNSDEGRRENSSVASTLAF